MDTTRRNELSDLEKILLQDRLESRKKAQEHLWGPPRAAGLACLALIGFLAYGNQVHPETRQALFMLIIYLLIGFGFFCYAALRQYKLADREVRNMLMSLGSEPPSKENPPFAQLMLVLWASVGLFVVVAATVLFHWRE